MNTVSDYLYDIQDIKLELYPIYTTFTPLKDLYKDTRRVVNNLLRLLYKLKTAKDFEFYMEQNEFNNLFKDLMETTKDTLDVLENGSTYHTMQGIDVLYNKVKKLYMYVYNI